MPHDDEATSLITWYPEPEHRHVSAARDYLTLVAAAADIERLMTKFDAAENRRYAAKDLLRAAGLPALPAGDPHVARDLRTIRGGQPLSPVLAVRGDLRGAAPLTIADGYHRLSACVHMDPNADVMCRIVALEVDD